ncbi:cysteine-rich repeat secretory protein 55-like [Dendrobium catenatum]|uniref:Cysteine-rich repeat secretory protein 55 n=1 Tax=Dendrobium catenatum TaxID=906689 RepID=A0A2I0WGR2_9ASPA|nr:cysteine-rich repeat secretory protein 55-like [Dendrobium catenatum]PKU74843.1 Cysteine-rich repeat secretory protein 55 [Dendrobium catenatum]
MAFSYKFFLVSLLFLPLANCENKYLHSCAKNIIGNVDLQARIIGVLYHLMKATPIKGFTSSSFSSSGDDNTLYALAQCRGDANTDLCSKCVKDAAKTLQANCSKQAQAYIWYDLCFLRYDTINFFGNWKIGGAKTAQTDTIDAKNTSVFVPTVKIMVDNLKSRVTMPGANLFAKMMVSKIFNLKGVSVYAMTECTRDMNKFTCIECLDQAEGLLPSICRSSSGCKILYNSCFIRYETYDFFSTLSH